MFSSSDMTFLGLEYEALDYRAALPFLLMLPGSLTMNEAAA